MFMSLIVLLLFVSPLMSVGLKDHVVDFHQSMKSDQRYDSAFADVNGQWLVLQKLYNDCFKNNLEREEGLRIPLIVHHIWLGSDFPEYAHHFRESWVKLHPEWTFITWTDHPSARLSDVVLESFQELAEYLASENPERFIVMDMTKLKIVNQHAFDVVAQNYGEKSDILRYEILYNIGGLYIDTDFECLKPFDDFHYSLDFYTGINHHPKVNLCNGLIASKPGSLILKDIIKRLENRGRAKGQGLASLTYSGPHFFTECFLRNVHKSGDRAVAFPVTYFYPWPHYLRHQKLDVARDWIRPESYAFHYWKVSWNK